VLLLASEHARSSDLPQRLREDFQIILHNVRLQARLIDDLLDLNRIQRGGLSISARRLNLRSVLEEVCKGLQSEAQERAVTLALECPPHDCTIRGDHTRLNQIFGNVLRNAIKFAPKHTTVHVQLNTTPCTAHVTIADSGPGIESEDLKRIFAPFVQAPHAGGTAGACGLGLGLAIAQRLVERHRGSIWAESDGPGHGARFHIELPLEPSETGLPHLPDPEANSREKKTDQQSLRLLLLEDHESTRLILSRMLQKHGFETVTAASIDAASRILSEGKIDLLLSDLGLPDGDGFHLPRLWKERIRIGAIALSGFGMENDVARSQACGFARHLTKPVEFQALLDAIEALSNPPKPSATPPA
jgi:CheY-like chemotaxis protein